MAHPTINIEFPFNYNLLVIDEFYYMCAPYYIPDICMFVLCQVAIVCRISNLNRHSLALRLPGVLVAMETDPDNSMCHRCRHHKENVT